MDFDTQGAVGGAASGAAIGTAFLPGVGTAVGLGVGAVAGGLFLGGKKGGPELPWDQYNQRLAEITNYQNQLAGAQASWSNAIANYNTTMMNLATPNLAAMYGAHGMSFDSGALAAEVARQASAYQAQGTQAIAKQNFNNINSVEAAKGDAWSAMFGMAGKNNQLGWANDNENKGAMMDLIRTAGPGIAGMFGNGTNPYNWHSTGTDYSSPVESTFTPGSGGGFDGKNSLGLNFSSYAPPRTEGGF